MRSFSVAVVGMVVVVGELGFGLVRKRGKESAKRVRM